MKYLVPIDGSENSLNAVKYAVELAKRVDADITLQYIIVFEPFLMSVPSVVESEGVPKAEKALAEAKSLCEGINVETITDRGASAADKIIDVAEDGNYDAIIIGSQGVSNLKRFAMGSVSTRVAQHSPCTVILVR